MGTVPKDVICLPEGDGRWVLMNVFAHSCLGVDSAALSLLREFEGRNDDEIGGRFGSRPFAAWDIEWFSNIEGLMADPTRYRRNLGEWKPIQTDAVGLAKAFEKHFLLVKDHDEYVSRFAAKRSLLDYKHFGNFHQQLGQRLLLERRQSPETWWTDQKFVDDRRSVRNNLYGAVQARFLSTYFAEKMQAGGAVLDLGCGTGFYANVMAKTAPVNVLGLDPNAEYIKVARENADQRARFDVAPLGQPDALNRIADASYDYVFMSDALLFYFVPPGPGVAADIGVLFKDIRRVLKPGGCFISMEPHYTFWLQPWLGDPERPFTVLTEYLSKSFGVTPTVGQLVQAYGRGGFAVTWMEELIPDPGLEIVDRRAYHFARQFPVWQLFELQPRG